MARKMLLSAAGWVKRLVHTARSNYPAVTANISPNHRIQDWYRQHLPRECANLIIQQAAAVEASIDGVAILDADFCVIYVNPAFRNLLGYSPECYLTERPWQEFVARNSLRFVKETIFPALRNTHRWRGEISAKSFDGSEAPVEFSIVKIDANSFSCIMRDISERKRQLQTIHETEVKYQTLVDMSQDGVYVMQDGKFVYVNNAFANSIGYSKTELVGLRPRDIVSERHRRKARETVFRSDCGTSKHQQYELYLHDKSSRTNRLFAFHESIIELNGRTAVTGTARDVTDQRRAESRLRYNAYHDSLTGLPNRDYFLESLQALLKQRAKNSKSGFAVLFLDLDRFKLINDTYGHIFGDRVLVETAKRLMRCLRPNDILARHGGDEYTILAKGIAKPGDATAIARRLLAALFAPILINQTEVFTNASIGIALDSPEVNDPADMLRDADTAMYRAKASGRGGFSVFDGAMHHAAQESLRIETELRNAVDQDEFRLAYQPIFELSNGALKGFETLIRWQHRTRGLLPPSEFLQVLEDTSLIISQGLKCLESACMKLNEWQNAYPFLDKATLSFNLSHRQFFHPEFLTDLQRVIFRSGFQPNKLCLEITESIFIENFSEAAKTLTSLRELGVALHLDDFGTGYSSLSSLQELPLNVLKIEKSFIHDIEQNPRNLALTKMIIRLGRDLGINVIAEGVETEQQLEILQSLSCWAVQGYFFSEPLLADQMTEYLKDFGTRNYFHESSVVDQS